MPWSNPARRRPSSFKYELTFCLRNRHPHILTVQDHGVYAVGEESAPFYVKPLYEGSLRTLMQEHLEPEKALRLFSQLLDGVEAAHLQEVVHRGLKPENVLCTRATDHLVVADFGIAQFQQDDLYSAVETKASDRLANFQQQPRNNANVARKSICERTSSR
jgi:serine/threonine protein kinase